MNDQSAPPLTIVQSGAGADRRPRRHRGCSSSSGDPTPEELCRSSSTPPGRLARSPHLHTREDDYSIVTEGEIGFRSGDREVVPGAGGYISKPRHGLHAMWNAGATPARMIEILSPAGFENFFRDVVALSEAEGVTFEGLATIAGNYGLEFGEPDWLPDITARYNLTPPPAPGTTGGGPAGGNTAEKGVGLTIGPPSSFEPGG